MFRVGEYSVLVGFFRPLPPLPANCSLTFISFSQVPSPRFLLSSCVRLKTSGLVRTNLSTLPSSDTPRMFDTPLPPFMHGYDILAIMSCKCLYTREKASITPYLSLHPEEFVSWLIGDHLSLLPFLLAFILLDLFSLISGRGGRGNACMVDIGCRCPAISFLLRLRVEMSFCSIYLSGMV